MKKGLNASEVLANVEAMLMDAATSKVKVRDWSCYAYIRYRYVNKRWLIDDVYKDLSIFDWWNDYLSVSQLRQMRDFLKAAIKRGFTGFACFKVGAKYCANGMWVHTKESEDGLSPDGSRIYHSFTPEHSYWDVCDESGKWIARTDRKDKYGYDIGYQHTLKEVDAFLAEKGMVTK